MGQSSSSLAACFKVEGIKPETQPSTVNEHSCNMDVTLIVKASNQQCEDLTIKCEPSWTIRRLKGHLTEVYPGKPVSENGAARRTASSPPVDLLFSFAQSSHNHPPPNQGKRTILFGGKLLSFCFLFCSTNGTNRFSLKRPQQRQYDPGGVVSRRQPVNERMIHRPQRTPAYRLPLATAAGTRDKLLDSYTYPATGDRGCPVCENGLN